MREAFYGCSNIDWSATDAPDLRLVTDMYRIFRDSSFNQDISDWDVSNVTSMRAMFYNTPFNQDIGGWDVGNVTDMGFMFYYSSFDQDIGGWDVSKVTSMRRMFYNTPFNQDIGSWDVGNVTDMHRMFSDTPFNQDISNWDFSNVTNAGLFLSGSQLSTANYDALLIALANRADYSITKFEQDDIKTKVTASGHSIVKGNTITISGTSNYNGTYTVLEVDENTFTIDTAYVADDATGTVIKDLKSNVEFHAGNSKYSAGDAETAKQYIIDTYNWTITDGGEAE